MAYLIDQTAVIIPVPAAEPAVATWRARFDVAASYGVPAHLTVIFPFVPVHKLTDRDLFDLRSLFALQSPLDVTFCQFGRFPTVLYLDPEPAEPFRGLTAAMVRRWPEAPPYEGRFADAVPHLTVTETASEAAIAAVRHTIAPALPIRATLRRALLIRFDGERWVTEQELPFRA